MAEPRVDKIVEKGREAAENLIDPAVKPVKAVAAKAAEGFRQFAEIEASSGAVLLAAAVAAILLSNSPWNDYYTGFLETHLEVRAGTWSIDKSIHHWINDGLMAIFFFLVGLEIKREAMEGELRRLDQLALPGIAALGGICVPIAIYVAINWGGAERLQGWAIPAATDIAFALAVLALLGDRVPAALKAFLLAVAIFDDIGAILVIAIFYSERLAETPLTLAALCFASLVVMNLAGVRRAAAYILIGVVFWVAVLKSGVHATIAGVMTALAIPSLEEAGRSTSKDLEDALHPWVAFLVMPLFGFANAGVSLKGVNLETLADPLPLGIAMGLLLGKPIGICLFSAPLVAKGVARLPERTTWPMFLGVSMLAGIGFTMSLFIGGLAFDDASYNTAVRLGVLTGSITSALLGLAVLFVACPRQSESTAQ